LFGDFDFHEDITGGHCPFSPARRRKMNLSNRQLSRLFSGTLILVITLEGAAIAQRHPRNILLDSIAWVPQTITVPGVVAGNAIWFDYNNDGRLDILLAGMSQNGPVSGIYRNDSTGFVQVQADICPLISEHGLAWGDFDNDGNIDFAIEGRPDTTGDQSISKIYRNVNGTYVDGNAQIMNLDGGSVTWVDYDNDGHLDLLISGSPDQGRSYATKLYRNINGKFYEEPVNLPGVWGSSVAWADYDKDGYQDVLISGYGGWTQTRLLHNAMSRGVIGFDEVYAPVDSGGSFAAVNSSAVLWFDYDNDGYPDLLVTGAGYGGPVAKIYHNNKDGTFRDIAAKLKPVSVSAVAVGDYDNDGYLDIAISGSDDFFTGSNPTTKIYHNNGDGTFTDIGAKLVGTWFGSLDWGDYDRDGRLDLLVTGATLPRNNPTYGADLKPVTVLYKNTVVVESNSAPAVPGGLAAQVGEGKATLSWSASTDKETDQKAISYSIKVGTHPGGFDIVSPLSNTSSGFRRLPKSGSQGASTLAKLNKLPVGTYYWSVQAVDNQYAGSSFSEEKIFQITASSVGGVSPLPAAYTLKQNYPNPFNPATVIEYALPKGGLVVLTVYDILGREVSTLVNGWNDAGVYRVRWNASGFASGVYCYRLQCGSYSETKTMIVIR
jgi:hypothetical protein